MTANTTRFNNLIFVTKHCYVFCLDLDPTSDHSNIHI